MYSQNIILHMHVMLKTNPVSILVVFTWVVGAVLPLRVVVMESVSGEDSSGNRLSNRVMF